jgi:hypothetical protein
MSRDERVGDLEGACQRQRQCERIKGEGKARWSNPDTATHYLMPPGGCAWICSNVCGGSTPDLPSDVSRVGAASFSSAVR